MIKNKKIKMEQCTLSTGKVVIISDIHIPFQDNKAVGAALDYINKVRPKVVVLNGDIVDFFKLSHFTKGEGRNPAQEIKECQKLFKQLKKVLDEDAKIYYVIGNHETRLEKYVLQNAPEVASIIDDVFSILEVEKYGIVGCSQVLFNKLFLCRHGKLLGKYSGMSAMKELAASYTSGASGHCFSEDVEVITPTGWKRIIDVQLGELVGTYNKQTKEFEYNKVNDKFVYDNYTELYHIKSNCIDIMTTGEHGFIGYGKATGKLKEFTAKELSTMSTVKIPLACQGGNPPIALSNDMIRLLINISADASIEDNSFRFHLKKERKIKHLTELLNNLGFKYSVRPQAQGTTKIRISTGDSLPILNKYFKSGIKTLPTQLREVDKEQAKIILDEYSITDGNKNRNGVNAYQISTSKKEEADLLQEIFVKNGMRSSCIQRSKDRYKPSYVLTINLRGVTDINKHNVSIVPYEGRVSCVSVDNGTLVVRSKGKTIVTQNSHRLSLFICRKNGIKYVWMETGGLMDMNPTYIVNPDWQQGFGVVEFYNKEIKHAYIKQIENGVVLDE